MEKCHLYIPGNVLLGNLIFDYWSIILLTSLCFSYSFSLIYILIYQSLVQWLCESTTLDGTKRMVKDAFP